MFVNQDLLLAEHSGVATVWLLSTLGNKSSYKKISKRDIQSVSIPQTCDVIKNPPKPMALRLTSNLLYGVALIYKQKTDYLNNDIQLVKTKIQRDVFNKSNQQSAVLIRTPQYILRPADLNRATQGGNGNNQVLLNDDPMFNVQNDLLPNMDDMDFLYGAQSTQLVNSNNRRDQIRRSDLENNTVSVILSTITNSTEEEQLFTRNFNINNDDILDTQNPEFAFDEEGMILDLQDDTTAQTGAGAAGDVITNDDIDLGFDFDFDNGDPQIPLTPVSGVQRDGSLPMQSTPLGQIVEEVDQVSQNIGQSTPSAGNHLQGRKRKAKSTLVPVIVDDELSLQTSDLRGLRDNYVEMMKSQTKKPKRDLPNITQLLNDRSYLPTFALRSLEGLDEVPQDQIGRGRSPRRAADLLEDGDEEDFVDGLMRKARRSSESLEVPRRNTSSTRRSSRASLSGINIAIEPDQHDQTTDNYEMDFNFNFEEDLDRVQPGSDSGGKRRSSSITTRFSPNREGEVRERPRVDKKTQKFLSFIESRFEEEDVDSMKFEQLMSFENKRSLIVKSFYEVLQLTTINYIEISKKPSTNDKFAIQTANDFAIRLV